MGASKSRSVQVDLPPSEARALVEEAATPLTKYKPRVNPNSDDLCWRKGWGLSNPVTVKAELMPAAQGTTVTYTASILALFDPFGFTKGALDQFEQQLLAHREVRGTDQPPSPVVADNRGWYVFGGFLVLGLGTPCVLGVCGGVLGLLGNL